MATDVARIVRVSFWDDRLVLNEFSPEDRYFWIYLLTNPYTSQLGIYELPVKIAAAHLGYSQDVVRVLLERFQNKYGRIKYNPDTGEVAIKNFLRHSIIKGGKPVYDCLVKDVGRVKDASLIEWVFTNLDEIREAQFSPLNATVAKFMDDYRNGMFSGDVVDETEDFAWKAKKVRHQKPFVPPTAKEVEDYCKEKGYGINARDFCNFYESRGWMIGKTPMSSWRKATATWESRRKASGKPAEKPDFDWEGWLHEEG